MKYLSDLSALTQYFMQEFYSAACMCREGIRNTTPAWFQNMRVGKMIALPIHGCSRGTLEQGTMSVSVVSLVSFQVCTYNWIRITQVTNKYINILY